MAIIGITGGVGTGKSTVARILTGNLPAQAFDADACVHSLLANDTETIEAIRCQFGPDVFSESGLIDRSLLRQTILRSPDRRKSLEAILHPKVRRQWQSESRAFYQSKNNHFVAEIPLLYETGAAQYMDVVVVVGADRATQMQRVQSRGLSRQEAEDLISTQMPLSLKVTQADFVIWNDGTLESLRDQIQLLTKKILLSYER